LSPEFLLISLLIVLTPGTGMIYTLACALTRGWRAALLGALGGTLSIVPHIAAAVFGLAAVLHASAVAFQFVKYLGVAYLLFLAWKMWFSPAAIDTESVKLRGSAWRMFGAGLSVTLGNPKIMVFYMALLPTLLDLGSVSLSGWVELVAIMLVVLVSVDVAWVLLAVQARRMLKSPRAVRIANRASAGLMAGAAGAIATR
jgi:threonine/homoserine/homoserine lactone efflux protein